MSQTPPDATAAPGAPGVPDAAAQLARLDAMESAAQQRLEQAEASLARTEQIAPEGVSDKGWVRVVLDAQAVVTDVAFSDGAPVGSPDELGAAVKQAHDRAVLRWRDEVGQIAEEELEDAKLRGDVQQAARDAVPAHVVDDAPEDDAPEDDAGEGTAGDAPQAGPGDAPEDGLPGSPRT